MSFIGVAILGSAAIGAGASIYGATQQEKAAQQAQQTLQQGQQSSLSAIQKYLAPFISQGQSAFPTLQSLLQPGQNQTDTLSKLPGFQFTKDIATETAQAGAGRTGFSGTSAFNAGTLGANIASTNWQSFLAPLMQLYGMGQGAAGQAAQGAAGTAQAFAPAIAQTQVGMGNVLAGGAQGAAGAVGGAANSLSNLAILSKLTGNSGMYGGIT